MSGGPIEDLKKVGKLVYDASCPPVPVSAKELVAVIKKNSPSQRTLTSQDVKDIDLAHLTRGDLTKLGIQSKAEQTKILGELGTNQRRSSCQAIEKVIAKTQEKLAADSKAAAETYRREGIKGLADKAVVDAKRLGRDAKASSEAGARDLVKRVGTLQTWFAGASALVVLAVVLVLYAWNPWGVSKVFPASSIIIVLSMIAVAVFGYNWLGNTVDCGKGLGSSSCRFVGEGGMVYSYLGKAVGVLAIAVLSFSALVFIATLLASLQMGVSVFKNTVLFFIGLGALTAIYSASKVVQKAVKQPIHPPTVTKLIARLIFYIPCLVADALERLLKEYKEEKGITWYVLGIEAVLVMMYFVVPLILELVQNYDGSLILDKPIYLGTQETHGSPEILYGAVLRDGDYDYSKARKHVYAISAWFRINPQPVSKTGPYSDDATILTFGDRPSVTYNNSTQRFKVLCKLSDSKTVSIYETTEIPLQSWTNIVINSDGANMTVFINGVLVASQPNIAPVTQYDLIQTGQEGGMEGGIKNIRFRRRTMSPAEINLNYKTTL